MEGLADAVANADSPYAIIAIALIGLYALGWRWGGKMIERMDENTKLTRSAKNEAANAAIKADNAADKAAGVAQSILTNHGSKNLGDAVDRITEWLLQHMQESKYGMDQLHTLQSVVVASALESENIRSDFTDRLQNIDDLIEEINGRLNKLDPPLRIDETTRPTDLRKL